MSPSAPDDVVVTGAPHPSPPGVVVATVVIDGRAIARAVLADVAREAEAVCAGRGAPPTLATVLVGDDPASHVYVSSKHARAHEVGIAGVERTLPADASDDEIVAVVRSLADDAGIDGILVQLPLPGRSDPTRVIDAIPWTKDVDGLTTTSVGRLHRRLPGLRPCTPSGVLTMLDAADVPLAGREVVVVGRSDLVGGPLAAMLVAADATVTVVHSRSVDAARSMRRADVVVVAAGVCGLVGREDVRSGAVVVDVGIHRTAAGLCGDVRTDELLGHASVVTPVPGGVGPLTIAELLRNTVRAAVGVQQ